MARELREGDVLYSKIDDMYYVFKILKIDRYNGNVTYHHLTYVPVHNEPDRDSCSGLEVWAWHAPVASFGEAIVLYNEPVREEELQGFHEYLKLTDFQRYIDETGQDLDRVIAEANEAYMQGYRLTDDGDLEGALEMYTMAIDRFPFFYEALDNRAFVKMDMCDFSSAIYDFQRSLEIKPESYLAEFSIGECYFKIGKYDAARQQFLKALEIKPEDELAMEWLGKTERMIADSGDRD